MPKVLFYVRADSECRFDCFKMFHVEHLIGIYHHSMAAKRGTPVHLTHRHKYFKLSDKGVDMYALDRSGDSY